MIWAPNPTPRPPSLPAKPKRSVSTSNNSGKEKMLKFFCFPQNAVSCALVCRSPWGIAIHKLGAFLAHAMSLLKDADLP
jgi:hypothetical protein